jgi:hypothetical protein
LVPLTDRDPTRRSVSSVMDTGPAGGQVSGEHGHCTYGQRTAMTNPIRDVAYKT